MSTIKKVTVLNPSCKQVPQLVEKCSVILNKMTIDPTFSTLAAVLAQTSDDLTTLKKSQDEVLKGNVAMYSQRNADRDVVQADMRLLASNVEHLANLNPLQAAAIIASAGMIPVKPRVYTKETLRAKPGEVSGAMVLETKAVRGPVQYCWQVSTDQVNWTDLSATFKTKRTLDGLTPGMVYSFRCRSMTEAGFSEWSPIVSCRAL